MTGFLAYEGWKNGRPLRRRRKTTVYPSEDGFGQPDPLLTPHSVYLDLKFRAATANGRPPIASSFAPNSTMKQSPAFGWCSAKACRPATAASTPRSSAPSAKADRVALARKRGNRRNSSRSGRPANTVHQRRDELRSSANPGAGIRGCCFGRSGRRRKAREK